MHSRYSHRNIPFLLVLVLMLVLVLVLMALLLCYQLEKAAGIQSCPRQYCHGLARLKPSALCDVVGSA
jgi:hypothetical protein